MGYGYFNQPLWHLLLQQLLGRWRMLRFGDLRWLGYLDRAYPGAYYRAADYPVALRKATSNNDSATSGLSGKNSSLR